MVVGCENTEDACRNADHVRCKSLPDFMTLNQQSEEIMNFFEKVVFCIRMFAKGYRIRKIKLPDSRPDANGNYFDFERL